jgi:myo-inositol-1(or 4)-monophosphatase
MPETRPSAEAERWLAAFRRACDAVAAAVAAMPVAERATVVGRGAGGDDTVLIDRTAEDLVVAELERLAAEGTGFRLVSEELGERRMGADLPVVVLDPIDGSLNAKRGMPVFATSIALATGPTLGDVALGLVRDHGTGEEFVAERGRGAWLDGRPLTGPGGPLRILMVEGASPERVAPLAAGLGGRVRRLRALGSLAISICAAAARRGDAAVGMGAARSVDVAAAQLVAREAGMVVGMPAPKDLAAFGVGLEGRRRIVAAWDRETHDLLTGLIGR